MDEVEMTAYQRACAKTKGMFLKNVEMATDKNIQKVVRAHTSHFVTRNLFFIFFDFNHSPMCFPFFFHNCNVKIDGWSRGAR